MNTLRNIGTKLAGAMLATGLVAGAAFAAGETVTVNLPQAVTVGGAVLPSGEYQVTENSLGGGSANVLVFRSADGHSASAMAMKSADPAVNQKTEVVLSNNGGALRMDKLFIAGDGAGYQFAR